MHKLKFGDVVKILTDKGICTGYEKGTLAAVVDSYNSGDKMRYRVADSKCKYVLDGWWYDEDEIEFTGRNVAVPKKGVKRER